MNKLKFLSCILLLASTFVWADKTIELTDKIVVEGTGDDSASRTALRKLTHNAIKGGELKRVQHAKSLIAALESKKDKELKAFILRELMFAGRNESVKAISKYLNDETLCEAASRALIGIYQHTKSKDIKAEFALAFAKASGANELTLAKACASLKIGESSTLKKLKKMAADNSWPVRQCALQALASIGAKECESFFVESINKSKSSERAFSINLYLLYSRRLAKVDKKAALNLCRKYIPKLQAQSDAPHLVNCLSTLVEIDVTATEEVIKYLEHPNPRISKSLSRVLERMKSETVNKRLLSLMKTGSTSVKVSALSILLKNAPAKVTPFIVEFLNAKEEALKSAALKATSKLDAAEAAPFLLKALLSSNAEDQELARSTFSQLQIDQKTADQICSAYKNETSLNNKKTLISLLAENSIKGAISTIISAAEEGDSELRKTAIKALKTTSRVEDAQNLLNLLRKVESNEVRYIQYALVSAFRGEQVAPQINLLVSDAGKLKDKHQAAVFNTLASIDASKAIEALRRYALENNEDIQKGAIKALAGSPSILAADILAEACGQGTKTCRILAARGLIQLCSSIEENNLLKKRALTKALPKIESPVEKEQIKKALSSIHAINNLALGKEVKTKGRGSQLKLITDGEISKKAAAGISGKDTSFQLDLGNIEAITAIGLTFSFDGKSHYSYDIDFSNDEQNWQKIASVKTPEKATETGFIHHFPTQKARYFRISNIICKRGNKISKSIRVVELSIYPEGEAPLESNKQ